MVIALAGWGLILSINAAYPGGRKHGALSLNACGVESWRFARFFWHEHSPGVLAPLATMHNGGLPMTTT